jgi:hypothetical protein
LNDKDAGYKPNALSIVPVILTIAPLEWAIVLTLSMLWVGSCLFNGLALSDLPPLPAGLDGNPGG